MVRSLRGLRKYYGKERSSLSREMSMCFLGIRESDGYRARRTVDS